PFCCSGCGFGTDAQQLTVFGQATIGSIEDKVKFVGTRRDRLRAYFSESAKERFWILDAQFDFDFGWHEGSRITEGSGLRLEDGDRGTASSLPEISSARAGANL